METDYPVIMLVLPLAVGKTASHTKSLFVIYTQATRVTDMQGAI
jgi:hypothetical protein